MSGSITVGEGSRPHPTARATPTVAEIVEGGSTNRLMGTGRSILPGAKRRSTYLIRRSAQARRGSGIEVSGPDLIARRTCPITKVVKIGFPDGLSCPAEPVKVVESGTPYLHAGAGLREPETGEEEK